MVVHYPPILNRVLTAKYEKSINNEEDGRTGNPLGDSSEAAPSKRKKRAEIKKEKNTKKEKKITTPKEVSPF